MCSGGCSARSAAGPDDDDRHRIRARGRPLYPERAAAVVIGGVSLTGGRGGIVGPVIAAFVLTLIPVDLIFLNIDPNFGQVIQGTLIVLVVMAGGLITSLRSRK